MSVNTVCGPIDAKDLGNTLMHEHFAFGHVGYMGDGSFWKYSREDGLAIAREMADLCMPQGVRTIVDPTPNENGRDAELLKEASELTGLNIVCATGFYYEPFGASPYWNDRMTFLGMDIRKEIAEVLLKELTVGIEDTGIKAGVIKVATGKDRITPYEEALFKAAAEVQKETGALIMTHTTAGTMGPEQADLLIAEGADPEKILIGHMDANPNINYQLEVLKRGVNIGFDQMGLQGPGFITDKERLAALTGLLALGYADRIVLSQDTPNYWLGRERYYSPEMMKLLENFNVGYVNGKIIPWLHKSGVSKDITDQMIVENPKRLLDIVPRG